MNLVSNDLYTFFASLQHFHLLRPYWLLLIVPMVFILQTLASHDDSLAHWRKNMSDEILEQLTVKGTSSRFISPKRVSWLTTFLLVIVLAGPSWQQQSSPFSQDDSALVIALDVSKTMQQNDLQPSRLIRAKQKIIDLLAVRGDANTALIAYSGTAHIVMPITNDSEMIRHFLDVLEPQLMPTAGKLPQNILPLAESLLAPTLVPGTVLLVGDGATSDTVEKFKQFFQSASHQLVVWAIGDVERVVNQEADSTIIPLQLSQLNLMASESDGRLVTISHDKDDVYLVNSFINNNLTIVEDASRPWHDAGYPIVFLVAALFLLWFRKGWTLQW
ncbi:VWA domain-containing protein [Moritella sp. Urea-trap-13]|uniref:VWA domain-containing protein n=1 Tax=Moritella sp. Urea-trap-13 TaxID=2058327 RepID=UPI000C31ED24|nr:VWA domain-containing protein [Moritella sp. Urea-trap-13]PKH06120.1 hypothetical protein CXF93_09300 [Moritella sp. Urea-trap-13]